MPPAQAVLPAQPTPSWSDVWLAAAALLLVAIGVMQLFFWTRRPRDREHAAITLVSVCAGLFCLFAMPSVRGLLGTHVWWFRLSVASAAGSAAAYCLAFRRIFELERADPWLRGLATLFAALGALFLVVPNQAVVRGVARYGLSTSLLVMSLATLALAMVHLRRGERHGRFLTWGVGLLAVALLNEMLGGSGVLSDRPSLPVLTLVGTVAWAASLAVTTAEKFLSSETAALVDRLTGLYRREIVVDALAREIRRAARVRQPLAVIMFDVDRFKVINDTLGHQVGDLVLAEIGRRMREAGRVVDWLGRYGGEEFLGVLASTNKAGGVLAAERIRGAVAALPIATGRTACTVTLSAGVAAYDGGEERPTREQLIGAADAAMYRAKNAGRNRVEA